jgi:hypothetical protein
MSAESPSNILVKSLDKRINILFSKLNDNISKFHDFYLNGKLIQIPKLSEVLSKNFYKSKIKLPITYSTHKRYRIKLDCDHIYDLYKTNNNYHFIKLVNLSIFNQEFYTDFQVSICNSFIFYLFNQMLSQITNDGLKINLHDKVYSNLTSKYNSKSNYDIKIYFTTLPDPSRAVSDDTLYMSLFN